jgi:hypothetical protein
MRGRLCGAPLDCRLSYHREACLRPELRQQHADLIL